MKAAPPTQPQLDIIRRAIDRHSIEELASISGVSIMTIRRVSTGTSPQPATLSTLLRACHLMLGEPTEATSIAGARR